MYLDHCLKNFNFGITGYVHSDIAASTRVGKKRPSED